MSSANLPTVRYGRSLVSESLVRRLSARIACDHGVDRELAERIVDQAVAFVATCGSTGRDVAPLSPSRQVDIGWHTFIWLDTRAYHEFCERVCGRYIHHIDHDGGAPGQARADTVDAIRQAGFFVDAELWPSSASCGPCHEDGNCNASGGDGNENSDTRRKFAAALG
ncbi:glycine-rich domain-containing protein [Actinokineospora fastidiosa]|uniref:Uncharacterized protein n=1 Tax=Actinokineospora fastidiosa TaxID=1816 RepID=A0A918LG42_9PSEU|nr:hypothetical protein [Actinokineospora fastidiosa]GGS42590.1 hypothetical protein GCM10010171_41930 [Actinokineospora fastidiosa]